jgi:hypothetical protein
MANLACEVVRTVARCAVNTAWRPESGRVDRRDWQEWKDIPWRDLEEIR